MAILPLLMASLIGGHPVPAVMPGNASIDYARGGGIRDWHAVDDRGIYLRDRTGRWYYAAFRHSCPGVLYNPRIAFDTNGFDRFDRLSRVVAETEVCAVESVDYSNAPADKGGQAQR